MAQFSKERVKWVGFSDLDISGNLSYSGLYGVHNNGAGGGGGGGLSSVTPRLLFSHGLGGVCLYCTENPGCCICLQSQSLNTLFSLVYLISLWSVNI